MDLYDHYQNKRIRENKDESRTEFSQKRDRIYYLEKRIDKLNIFCVALSELLEELGVGKEKVISKVEEIDLRNGKLDGKYEETVSCPECDRPSSTTKKNCVYCGEALGHKTINI